VFAPAIDAGYTWLAIVGVLASALSAYYYLRVIYVFWMQSKEDEAAAEQVTDTTMPRPSPAAVGTLVVCAAALVALGLFAGGVLETTAGYFSETAMAAAP
jgi:NADH-quinone oxidoreductase subunit N